MRIVARMNRLANATGMRWGRRDSARQWGDVAHERKEQQKFGDQTMHTNLL
jgi:hypothetical protein